MTQFSLSVHREKKLSHFDLKSWVTWVELRQKHLNWRKKNIKFHCIGYPTGNGQSNIIAKAVNKKNTSKFLLYKLCFKMILISFEFQCDFDFQITTFKMILILNHLYLCDLILILKPSTYGDFVHLWSLSCPTCMCKSLSCPNIACTKVSHATCMCQSLFHYLYVPKSHLLLVCAKVFFTTCMCLLFDSF